GRLIHYGIDLVLISTVLAGIRRSTGVAVATDKIKSQDVRSFIEKYLAVGEASFDIAVGFASASGYFERR
ncbi:DUF1748-domain-containing protein, partial [Ramicandelaber brevisporus]